MNLELSMLMRLNFDALIGGGQRNNAFYQFPLSILTGTAADQADQLFINQGVVVNNATPKVFDMNAGGLVGQDFSAFSVAKITDVILFNLDPVQWLTLSPAAANAWVATKSLLGAGSTLRVGPTLDLTRPSFNWAHCQALDTYTVAAAADQIAINTDGGANVGYLLALIGRSV
jgi:hypothetical protein